MKERHKTKWTFIRVNVFIIAIVVASLLVSKVVFSNLPFDGRLQTIAIPGEPSPFFGGFRPVNRTKVFPHDYTALRSEPIYFSMAVPPFFHSAIVRMEYRNLGQPVIEIGARTSLEEWSFLLKPIEADESQLSELSLRKSFLKELKATPKPKTTPDGWSISETYFDFGPLAIDAHGDVQMIVSLPGMKTHQGDVLVRNVQIEYIRPPLTLEYLVELLRNKITL